LFAILLHAVLAGIFVLLYWRMRRRWICHVLLAFTLAGYATLYAPVLATYSAFREFRAADPEIAALDPRDVAAITGIFIRQPTCAALCKELLLNGNVALVETRSHGVRGVSRRINSRAHAYTRWRLERSAEVCWNAETLRNLAMVNIRRDRALLAQGYCFIPQPIDSPSADLQIDVWRDQTPPGRASAPGGNRFVSVPLAVYEVRLKTREGRQTTATEKYNKAEVLAFPLQPYLMPYFIIPAVEFRERTLSYGAPTIKDLIRRITNFDMPVRSTYGGHIVSSAGAALVQKARIAHDPAVRWSAAFALCLLNSANSGKFDMEILTLRHDPNPWVGAAALSAQKGFCDGRD
jgi:hypothetical protein